MSSIQLLVQPPYNNPEKSLRAELRNITAERLYDEATEDLAQTKAAVTAAEENLHELRDSTDSLKAEIGTALQSKAV